MLGNTGKFGRLLFFLVLGVLFAQAACGGGGGDSADGPPPRSANSAGASNAGNLGAVNSANGANAVRPGTAPPDAPVISGGGGGDGYPLPVYPEAPRGGNPAVQSPDSGGHPGAVNGRPQFGGAPNNPPVVPGLQGQNHSPDYAAPGETEYKPATPVMFDLEAAIDRWSSAEAAGYGLKETLVALWRRRNPTIKYNPVGIDTLTSRIKERPAFVNCQRAQKLSRSMFHDDGIKTVGHLYDYLEPCGGSAGY